MSKKYDSTGYVSANEIKIITDPTDPLYDPRINEKLTDPKFKALVANIKVNGIIQPVTLKLDDEGTLVVVAGRRRVRAAKILADEGVDIKVPYILNQEGGLSTLISENELRKDDDAITKAEKVQRLFEATDGNWAEVSVQFGQNHKTLRDLVSLLTLSPKVQDAIRKGVLPYDLALSWKNFSHESQDKKLADLKVKAAEKGNEKVSRKDVGFKQGVTPWGTKRTAKVADYAQTPAAYKLLLRVIAGKASEEDIVAASEKFSWIEAAED